MYVKSVRDNRNSMARINCAEKLNNQCGAQYSYCARGREGAKTAINWRAAWRFLKPMIFWRKLAFQVARKGESGRALRLAATRQLPVGHNCHPLRFPGRRPLCPTLPSRSERLPVCSPPRPRLPRWGGVGSREAVPVAGVHATRRATRCRNNTDLPYLYQISNY